MSDAKDKLKQLTLEKEAARRRQLEAELQRKRTKGE
jgi:hypothetical protein